jgi:hypothetical protein
VVKGKIAAFSVIYRMLVAPAHLPAVIPPFHAAIDRAVSYLDKDGLMGVADFFVSSKYDLPMRQMSWARRFFWRCGALDDKSSALKAVANASVLWSIYL